jgi:hypothetical protein
MTGATFTVTGLLLGRIAWVRLTRWPSGAMSEDRTATRIAVVAMWVPIGLFAVAYWQHPHMIDCVPVLSPVKR